MRTGEITSIACFCDRRISPWISRRCCSWEITKQILPNPHQPQHVSTSWALKDNAGLVKEYALVDAVASTKMLSLLPQWKRCSASMPIKTTLKLTMQRQKVPRRSRPQISCYQGRHCHFFKVDGRYTRSRLQYPMTFLTLKMVKLSKVK